MEVERSGVLLEDWALFERVRRRDMETGISSEIWRLFVAEELRSRKIFVSVAVAAAMLVEVRGFDPEVRRLSFVCRSCRWGICGEEREIAKEDCAKFLACWSGDPMLALRIGVCCSKEESGSGSWNGSGLLRW